MGLDYDCRSDQGAEEVKVYAVQIVAVATALELWTTRKLAEGSVRKRNDYLAEHLPDAKTRYEVVEYDVREG